VASTGRLESQLEPEEEARRRLHQVQGALQGLDGSAEVQADALIKLLEELEGLEGLLPNSPDIRVELAWAREKAARLRDELWLDARRQMRTRAMGLTLARRLQRTDDSVRLLERAKKLDREGESRIEQDLVSAKRRLQYLQTAQTRAREERGKRFVVMGLIGAAVAAALLFFCIASELLTPPAFIVGTSPTQRPLSSPTTTGAIGTARALTISPTPSHTPVLAPSDVAPPSPTGTATPLPSHTASALLPSPTAAPETTNTPLVTRATATPEATRTPLVTATATPKATYTPAATATSPPTMVPAAKPKATTTALPPSPSPAATPTVVRSYPAPILLEPKHVSLLSQRTFSTYPLRWEWEGVLQADEWFDVRVWPKGLPHYGIAWTKEQEYLYDLCLQGSGEYSWSIAVVRGQDGQWLADLSPEAEPRRFTSARSDEWCTRKDRFSLSPRSGAQ
jgi:hypothetical protein